jgi:hypothetical protein
MAGLRVGESVRLSIPPKLACVHVTRLPPAQSLLSCRLLAQIWQARLAARGASQRHTGVRRHHEAHLLSARRACAAACGGGGVEHNPALRFGGCSRPTAT